MTSLGGRSIVVTRPERQAAELGSLIEHAGGRVLRFPVLEIEPVGGEALNNVISQLRSYDMAVFISRNAVEQGLSCVRQLGQWPAHLAVAAIGAGTRRALQAEGFGQVIAPEGQADSEALLERAELKSVGGKRIVVFRGIGGRELLAAVLRTRGALVDYAECYRRVRPESDPQPLMDAYSSGALHAVTISSAEGLANLDSLLGERGRRVLRETPLFVPHDRVAQAGRALGIGRVVVAGAADEEMLAALVAYFAHSG